MAVNTCAQYLRRLSYRAEIKKSTKAECHVMGHMSIGEGRGTMQSAQQDDVIRTCVRRTSGDEFSFAARVVLDFYSSAEAVV